MNSKAEHNKTIARQLLDDFLHRTGIKGEGGDPRRRYLWTDAFAVQCCFSLARSEKENDYLQYGLDLIDWVHNTLGKHRPDDSRTGWISGLSEEEGEKHPTTGGLRIGKKFPEKAAGTYSNPYKEMECDGQYLHYLTRWFSALTTAYHETGEEKYALWAAELIQVTQKFVNKEGVAVQLYWKMKTDLSEPSVKSMGMHDPLEGLLSILSIKEFAKKKGISLEKPEADLENICEDMSWFTTDALGIGGLLLNIGKAGMMVQNGQSLPQSIHPGKLLADSLTGLQVYSDNSSGRDPAETRLPFRECGLSLGIYAITGLQNDLDLPDLDIRPLEKFAMLAVDLENFWLYPRHREAQTWKKHFDINAVSLASSLLAHDHLHLFCPDPTG